MWAQANDWWKGNVFSGAYVVTSNINVLVPVDETWWILNLICIMDEAWEAVPDGWWAPWAKRRIFFKVQYT